jgi:hypothetical protein
MALQLDEQLRRHDDLGAPRQGPAELSLTPLPAEELSKIESRVADPDFWKDQAGAQKLPNAAGAGGGSRSQRDALRRRAEDLGRPR